MVEERAERGKETSNLIWKSTAKLSHIAQGHVVQRSRLLFLAGWQGLFNATVNLRKADDAPGPSRDWFLPLLFESDWSVSAQQNGGPAK